jgi:hypothetical protein
VCYEYRVKPGTDVLVHSNTVFCPSDCNEPGESKTHLECQNEACVEVLGAGDNECATKSDCTGGDGDVSCSPLSQTVDVDEWADLAALGGSGDYRWSAEGNPSDEDEDGARYRVRYDEAGTYGIEVEDTDTGDTDMCSIRVRDDGGTVTVTITPTPARTPVPTPVRTPVVGGQVGGAGAVPTGPGDVTALALLSAALATLLYVSYTHSRSYRAREARGLGRKRDPLDFQN